MLPHSIASPPISPGTVTRRASDGEPSRLARPERAVQRQPRVARRRTVGQPREWAGAERWIG